MQKWLVRPRVTAFYSLNIALLLVRVLFLLNVIYNVVSRPEHSCVVFVETPCYTAAFLLIRLLSQTEAG